MNATRVRAVLRTVLRESGRAVALGAAVCALACPLPRAQAEASAPDTHAPASVPHQVLVMLRMPAPHFRPDGAYGGYTDDGTRAARRRVARDLAAAYGLRVVDDWPMPAIGIDCFVMESDGSGSVERLVDTLAHDPRVAWAQSVQDYHGLQAGAAGADPLLPVQPAAHAWHLAQLHRAATGRDVAIAIVDSGVDADHPDLAGQVRLRRNFVDGVPDAAEAHGTAVAAIVAARAGNGVGIAGIAPGATLLALRACWETAGPPARCNSFTLGKAINFALMNDARIINLSLGGPPDRLLRALLDAALARGVALVGAVDPAQPDGGFPASHPGVIAVAAEAQRGVSAGVLRAPGTDVPTALPGARWGMVSGSSYATAHVTGLAALMLEKRPGMTPARLRADLAGDATVLPAAFAPDAAQAGSMDACAALGRAAGACVCQCPSTSATASLPLPRPR